MSDGASGGSGSSREAAPEALERPLRVALFDYGVGNLHSLGKAIEGAGAEVVVTRDWDEALKADALVLPGVGAFSAALEALPEDRSSIVRAMEGGLPTLGICLGMQLLFEESEEGAGRGLGVVPGRVRRLRAKVIPEMGWNEVETTGDPLFEGVPDMVAYYANSFVCEPEAEVDAIGWTQYEEDRFAAAVRRGSIRGVQFHPEKSSHAGRRLIANFLREVERERRMRADSALPSPGAPATGAPDEAGDDTGEAAPGGTP